MRVLWNRLLLTTQIENLQLSISALHFNFWLNIKLNRCHANVLHEIYVNVACL